MRRSFLTNAIGVLLVAGVALAAEKTAEKAPEKASAAENLQPFPVDWSVEANSPADLSGLLDAPAGATGMVRAAGGHFVCGDGKPIRFWGVNATMAAALPAKEDAARIALRLAQCGVNCVRMHFLDSPASWGGLVEANGNDTQSLDANALDRLDFFVAELKKRGVYTDLNLNVAHQYKPGDGVADCELLGYSKAVTYFNPRLIELQKLYARSLLTHRNPYTQSEYRNEPAVAIVEMLNENSLVESWFSGRLLGKNTTKNPGGWTDIPAGYAKELTGLYNAWLKEKLSAADLAALRAEANVPADAEIPRLGPKEFAKASAKRFGTEAAFYVDTERKFFLDMAKFLREDLGVKSLLVGSSDHNHGNSNYPHVSSNALLDVVDGHVYWQHPNYVEDPNTHRHIGFNIKNTPMVDDPLYSTPVQLSRTAVAGKPYIVSEVGHPFPAEFACEGIPILAAYAALQDWDGVFWYTLGHKDAVKVSPAPIGHFDLFPDPVKMCQLRAGALMFLRRDVAAAKQTVQRSYSRQQMLESVRLPHSAGPYFTPGFDLSLPLTHAVRIKSFDGPEGAAGEQAPAAAPQTIRSDTGELTWFCKDKNNGLVTVNTPRSQALIGYGVGTTANLCVEVEPEFCALTLNSLDDQPIAKSSKMLLTACARVANSGMVWDAKRKTLEKWGNAPACIEPVTGTIALQHLTGAKGVWVQPLDGAGQPMGKEIQAVSRLAGVYFTIILASPDAASNKEVTTWYFIRVER